MQRANQTKKSEGKPQQATRTQKEMQGKPTLSLDRQKHLERSLQGFPELLTMKQAAQALAVSYHFLQKRKESLILAGVGLQIDGAFRLQKNALIAWVCEKQHSLSCEASHSKDEP